MSGVRSSANETLSRWVFQGIPVIVGIGIVAAFALHFSFGLSLSKLAVPIAVLLGIQVIFYVSMYPARMRSKRTGDLRLGAVVAGMYALFIVLAGMY